MKYSAFFFFCGQRIQFLRQQHKWTQEQLAEKMNISSQYLSRLERGMQSGAIELLIEFAEVFQVSLDYLILGQNVSQKEVKEELLYLAKALSDLANKLN